MKFLVFFLVLLFVVPAAAELYPAVGIVTDLNLEWDIVTFTDFNGHNWCICGIEDWLLNDIGAILMEDCDTPEIEDDLIVEVRYAGYIREEREVERYEYRYALVPGTFPATGHIR